MSISAMTFHESYGEIAKSTLALIRRYNVSPADYDRILLAYGYDENYIEFSQVNAMIEAGSSSGTYRPSRYL